MNCEHKNWTCKMIPLSDGRPARREFCVNCGTPNGGTGKGIAVPMIDDEDLYIATYKHRGKTLGQIAEIDREYLKWVVLHSKASDRLKKSAARLYFGEPHISPKEGEIYSKEKIYNPNRGAELIKKLQNEIIS